MKNIIIIPPMQNLMPSIKFDGLVFIRLAYLGVQRLGLAHGLEVIQFVLGCFPGPCDKDRGWCCWNEFQQRRWRVSTGNWQQRGPRRSRSWRIEEERMGIVPWQRWAQVWQCPVDLVGRWLLASIGCFGKDWSTPCGSRAVIPWCFERPGRCHWITRDYKWCVRGWNPIRRAWYQYLTWWWNRLWSCDRLVWRNILARLRFLWYLLWKWFLALKLVLHWMGAVSKVRE